MDAAQLRNEAQQHRREAQKKGDQINRLNNDVLGLRAVDDLDQVQRIQDQAAELTRTLQQEEQRATEAEAQLHAIELRVQEIEKEQARLESEFKNRNDELDKEKRSILGSSGAFF